MSWKVGDYETIEEKPFDHGQFGTVWRARRGSDGTRVALKLVLCANGRDQIEAERHGAILQQQFHRTHAMVPEIYDYGQDGDDFYIAMELIEGGQLSTMIAAGPLHPRVAAEHTVWLCEFLDKAHRFAATIEGQAYVAIVHADLKPQHVLFTRSGEKRVLDFGIAKALARTSRVTTDNWCTTPYASPERLLSGQVNEHVDLWSLGVMLYEMLTGHRLYPHLEGSHSRSQLEHAITSNAARDPLPTTCPAGLAAIVNKMLAAQLERRYPTALAIKSDLDLFLSGQEPLALREYAAVATMPVGAAATRASQPATIPIGVPAPPIPPTEPLPARPSIAAEPAAKAGTPATKGDPLAGRPAPAERAKPKRRFFRGLLKIAATLMVLNFLASEGAVWVAAEHFRDRLDGLDIGTVTQLKGQYDAIESRSALHLGLHTLVDRPLLQRLRAVIDGVIEDYRRDEPTMGAAEWQQADKAVHWALQISPNDRVLRSRLLTCDAHLLRYSARNEPQTSQAARQMYASAIDKFRAAAQLDQGSYDPYLGITRIAVYGLNDVDAAAAAIGDAEKRGFTSGRRERAQLGDGYMRRADRNRRLARALSGDQHDRQLENARADYERCVSSFDPIVGFANAAGNLEYCKRQIERINRELTVDPAKLVTQDARY